MKKEGYVIPIIVLTVICLVVSGLLAYVNSITEPIITQASIEKAEKARKEVLPEADSFTQVEDISNLPEEVDEAYIADNGAGYVFILTGAGYGGDVQIIVGIDSDMTVTGTQVLSHSETAGLGARIAEDEFQSQFVGQTSDLEDVAVISGSTISSKCFIKLVEKAFEAAEILAGEGA